MIFGEENLTTVDESLHQYFDARPETTPHDVALNYIFGTLLICSAVISTILNPILFLFNYSQPTSASSRYLFMILAASDFFTNLYHPWVCALNFLKPTIGAPVRRATLLEQVDTVLFRTCTWSSLISTSSIAVCRFINIRFPFHKTNTKFFVVYHVLYLALVFFFYFDFIIGFGYYKATAIFFRYCQMVWKHPIIAYDVRIIVPQMTLMALTGGLGIGCSLLTVYTLLTKTQVPGHITKKSTVAIGLMNIGNCIFVVFQILYAVRKAHDPLVNYLAAGAMPIFLSAFNPLIRIAVSTNIKNTLKVGAQNKLDTLSKRSAKSQDTNTNQIKS